MTGGELASEMTGGAMMSTAMTGGEPMPDRGRSCKG